MGLQPKDHNGEALSAFGPSVGGTINTTINNGASYTLDVANYDAVHIKSDKEIRIKVNNENEYMPVFEDRFAIMPGVNQLVLTNMSGFQATVYIWRM